MNFSRVASLLAFLLLVPACQRAPVEGGKAEPSSGRLSAPLQVRPKLSPEPPPPNAALATEVPGLEAKLAADKAYANLWSDPKRRGELRLLLTALSELLATSDAETGIFVDAIADLLDKKKLMDPVMWLFGIHTRVGTYPADFSDHLKRFIAEVKSEERLGLWKPELAGEQFDITALAVFMNPEDPRVLRERLAAKKHGPFKWSHLVDKTKTYIRPYLMYEKAAINRLATLTDLTPAEKGRMGFFELPQIGDGFKLGEYGYVVTGARSVTELGNRFANAQASEGAVFVVVDYTIENLGNKTATVMAGDFRLIDLRGREFRPSSEASTALAMSGKSKDVVLAEVQPGLKKKMVTAFEVPADVTNDWFKILVPEKGALGTGKVVLGVELEE